MFSYFIHVPYCYQYLLNQIPIGLLLYAHLPVSLMALAFSTYVLIKNKSLPSILLFVVCFIFAIWCACDLSAWFAFLGSGNTMFTWSLLDFLAVLMFLFSYYFLYAFVTGRDLPLWQKIVALIVIAPTTYVAFTGLNIPIYDLNACAALEDGSFTIWAYIAQALFILASLVFVVLHYMHSKERDQKIRTLLIGAGVLTFLLFFFSASFSVSLFAASSVSTYVYNYLIYGLFGMPIFLIYLGYLIVRYRAFDLKMLGAQALVLALVVVLASEFAFVNTFTNRILVAVTLVLTAIAGTMLIRSVRKEIEQREHIEKLAVELEKANRQQVILLRFITHQLKGFVTKSRNVFSMLMEGDYGELPESMKPMVEEGFKSDTRGAETIQEILNAANIKSGKVTYAMAPFDLKALVEDIARDMRPAADAKGLELKLNLGDALEFNGDRAQLQNALKNLIDNSIKYTPSGSVEIDLKKEADKARFEVKDTGVGITPEDMKNLFTEGGHGKESQKFNIESTGFGLYIVKNIIESHGGKVWAESDGADKGSRFIVELPAK